MLFSIFCEHIRPFHLSGVLDLSILDLNARYDRVWRIPLIVFLERNKNQGAGDDSRRRSSLSGTHPLTETAGCDRTMLILKGLLQ